MADADSIPVGQQISDYAKQVADINARINGFFPNGKDPSMPNDAQYEYLRSKRDAIAGKAKELSDRAAKGGAAPIDFASEVRKAGKDQPKLSPFGDPAVSEDKLSPFGDPPAQGQATEAAPPPEKPPEIPQTSPLAVATEQRREGMAPPAADAGQQRALQEERNRVYKQLQAEGVKEPERDPRFQEVNRKYAGSVLAGEHEVAGFGPLGDQAVIKSVVGGIGKGLKAAAKPFVSATKGVIGTEGKAAMEGVRREAASRAGEAQYGEAKQAQRVAGLEDKVADAEKAASDLDAKLVAQPKMSADEFGKELRDTTQKYEEKYKKIRAKESGFSKALEDAGDTLRVDTSPVQEIIANNLKSVRNPVLQKVLAGTRDLLTSEAEGMAVDSLSVKSAESLRGYLSNIIKNKAFGDEKIDKETLAIIKQVRKSLIDQTMEAWPAYKEALGKWGTLSRPLDIVERNGGLKKVLAQDPISQDYALTEAQVVGQAIKSAKAGAPVLAKLLNENPQLRESARLYFTQDLFGKEIAPTAASFRSWLQANQRPLRQTGLYGEFKDMQTARQAAQRAVQDAKGELNAASVRETEQGRRLSKTHGGAAQDYANFVTELDSKNIVPKQIPQKAEALFKKLVNDGKIDQEAYDGLLGKLRDAEEQVGRTDALRKRAERLALTAALLGAGYTTWRAVKDTLGW